MAILKDSLLIGLTGSFGSGCTTFCRALEELGFKYYSLSDLVKEKWRTLNPGKSLEEATRKELQTIGNNLRREEGAEYLAKKMLKQVRKKSEGRIKRAVFDSIRNTAEVMAFRESHPNFFLIAIDAARDNRRNRVREQYIKWGLSEKCFEEDDERDKNEEGISFGQQVQLCVDEADVLIGNDMNYPNQTVAIKKFIEQTKRGYVDLLSGEEPRNPQPDESFMSIAYTASLLSKCIKRQVGAVILDENGAIRSIGYNENPRNKPPCIELYNMCYRDIYKQRLFQDLANQKCPSCNSGPLGALEPPYLCPNCNLDLDRFYVRDKALARCTALHAEEKAIINANGRSLKGTTLYVTTFPCFMCAHKILDVGISNIIYCEPYPDVESARVFKELDKQIQVDRFEGVKSRAYFRLFGSWRKKMEATV